MGDHEGRPIQAEATDQMESKKRDCPAIVTTASGYATSQTPDCNWEGYSPEILAVWFDP